MDTLVTVDTPEGVEIEFNVAGPVVRAIAWSIDFAARCVIYLGFVFFLFSAVPSDPDTGLVYGLLSIIAFLLEWLYPTLFEGLTGSTPGKKVTGLKVVQEDGTPLTFPSAIIRNFLRAVDFLPLLYVTGLVTMINNRRFQRLGDLAAGTLVVYVPQSAPTETTDDDTDSLPLPAYLQAEDRLTVVSFAERSSGLSPARQIELANTLSAMTGQQGEASVKILKGWANWIIRGQSHASPGSASSNQSSSNQVSSSRSSSNQAAFGQTPPKM